MPDHRRFPLIELKRLWRPAAVAAALSALALVTAIPASAGGREETFKVRHAISLPGGQKIHSFDIGWDDDFNGLYLLADRTNATVWGVDVVNNKLAQRYTANFAGAGPTPDESGPNGILTVNSDTSSLLWVGDFGNGKNGGNGGLVKVIDELTGKLVATISTGGFFRADELCYDAKDKLILMANDAEPFTATGGGPYVSFIDASTFKVVGQITMNGQNGTPRATNGIEQCQWRRGTNKFYLNIPEVNGTGNDKAAGAVLVIDPKTRAIVKTYTIPITECAGPQGMALGPTPQILLGCNDPNKTVPNSITINQNTGKTITIFPGEDGPDEVWFNPSDGHYFLARSGGATPQALGVIDASIAKGLNIGRTDPSQVIGLAGKSGNHSVAADTFTNKVFVPIADTSGATVCSSVGGDDSVGCIAIYKAKATGDESQ